MKHSFFRRVVLAVATLCHLLLTLAVAPPVLAQEVDRAPPTIAFEPLGEGRRGDTQVFSALVTDEDGEIERVTFHFRPSGTDTYVSRAMEPLPGTDIYTISVTDLDPGATAIEFYIDALDQAGNRSIEGFAFDPLVRVLVGEGQALAEASSSAAAPVTTGGLSTGRKVLYGVLGVVVVGALAAAAGGSGGGGGEGEPMDTPVTIVADPLP